MDENGPARYGTLKHFHLLCDEAICVQVRAAVRSLTLNVYGIEDGAVQEFVCSLPASSYFTELAIGMTEQCQARHDPCCR